MASFARRNWATLDLEKGKPPATSWWVGLARDGFARIITARKSQQAIPSDKDLQFDPISAATTELNRRLALAKAQAELRRRVRG